MTTLREIIRKKRDRETLTSDEITAFINAYVADEIADYHMSAWLMAVYLNGMNTEETLALTRAMRDSGHRLDLSSIASKKVDKHSTGGVGDKTSIVIAPIAAACGITVPMITGRALGHTGGTLDKLESIPGFNAKPSIQMLQNSLKKAGAVIMGQTQDLAPADRRMYALRDVTATIESIPLITASILSKKIAVDVDGLVLDVKTGGGAFMSTLESAQALARSIVHVCRKMDTAIVAIITDMEQPLGQDIGNALEIRECIRFLNGETPEDLETICLALAAYMIQLGGATKTFADAYQMAYEAVSSGRALLKFREIIRCQGGNDHVVSRPALLPRAKNVEEFRARAHGFVTRCDAKLLGLASNALGAGRNRLEDTVDPAVGLHLNRKTGDPVKRGDVLCEIHWNDRSRLRDALPLVQEAYEIGARRPGRTPLIHAVLRG